MLRAVLYALSSSEHTNAPFLAVMVLPIWDDSPWISNAVRDHTNMSTPIRIPSGHMRFVPANKQADETSIELKPTKWPVELVLIANDMGREIYLDNERIQTILSPAIQTICRLKPEESTFFPPPLYPRHTTFFRTPACPTRSLPHSPAMGAKIPQTGPPTPQQGPR